MMTSAMINELSREQIKAYLLSQFNLPETQVDAMIPGFIVALADHAARLDEAYKAGDLARLGKVGHTIKGALLNLGLHDCADLAYEIERKGKKQKEDAELHRLMKTLREKLKPYLAG